MTSQRGPRQNVDDQDVSAATTDMWELDVTNPPGAGHHHTLVPYPGSLQQSQPLPLQANVQSLNVSGHDMPMFMAPLTQPTSHIHQAQPSIERDRRDDYSSGRNQEMTSQRGPRQNVDDQDVSAATTDMWELDVTNPPGAGHLHTLVPYPGSLQSQQLALQANVQSLNVSGHDMPMFMAPLTQPTCHIHQAQPSIERDRRDDYSSGRNQEMTSQRGPRQNVDDQDVSAATTDMWELDVTNPPGAGHHHTLVPYPGSLQQSQQLPLQANVQSLNVSGHDMPMFMAPLTQPTSHIHQAQPSIDRPETSKRHHPPSRSVDPEEPSGKPSGTIPEVLNTKRIARISKDIGNNWKLLAAELDFEEPDIQTFAADAPLDQVEQTRTMLSEWVRRNAERGDRVDVLMSALKTIGLNDVALKVMSLIGDQPSHSQEIGPELRDRSQVAADKETRPVTDDQPSHSLQMSPELRDRSQVSTDKCYAVLKTRYKTIGSYVNINPWEDDDRMHIDIYTKLQLEKSEGASVVMTNSEMLNSIEYEKIFLIKSREGNFVKRLIFFGKGGVGKSTFFDKIAYDWAVGSSDVLNKYKLVFVLKMCALDQSSNLIDAIFQQLLEEDVDISEVALKSLINQNPNEVLILLDGFDELTTTILTETSFGSILKALNRKTYYRECCIGVTTRPSHLKRLMDKSLVQNPCIHLKVLGFTKDDVEEYVRKFFPGNSEALIKTIERSNVLSDLARNPMLLVLMCAIWREDAALPLTMSRLYSEAVENIFKRKGHESEEISEVLIKIGEVALNGLLDPELKLAFPESAFEKNTLALALKVGILNSQRVLKNRKSHNSIQFLHKTMQELCAAKYWQSLPPNQFQNILDRVCDDDFEYLLRFCCGDNELCMNRIIIPLLNPELELFELNKLALHCYFEGRSKEIPSETYIMSLVTDTIDIDDSNSDFHSLMFFLSNVCKSEFGRNYLGIIEDITLQHIFITESVDLFALVLSNMTNVHSLILWYCSLSGSDLKTILLSLKDNTRLNELSLDNTMIGGTASQWAPHIQHFTTLRDLSIDDCNIQPEDMEHIMKNVSKSKSECEVSFYDNEALGGKAEIWSHYLCLMIYNKELDLDGCSLVCNDIEHIANALSEMPNLTHLHLRDNSSLGGSANVWSRYLCLMIYIKELDLDGCSLVCNDIEHIANALSEMPNLTDLDLWNNSSLGGSVDVWSRYLCLMKHLQELNLGDCNLDSNDKIIITQSLSKMTNPFHVVVRY